MRTIQRLLFLSLFAFAAVLYAGCGTEEATTPDNTDNKPAEENTSTDTSSSDTDGNMRLVSLNLPEMT